MRLDKIREWADEDAEAYARGMDRLALFVFLCVAAVFALAIWGLI